MRAKADFYRNRATEDEIADHLFLCDTDFVPPLSTRVRIGDYARRMSVNSIRFEAWSDGSLIGLVATYCNDIAQRFAYITSVSVLRGSQGRRIASHLMEQCIGYLNELGFAYVELQVDLRNGKAIHMYERHGFAAARNDGRNVIMGLTLGKKP